jgi:hypothetical protein
MGDLELVHHIYVRDRLAASGVFFVAFFEASKKARQ